MNIKKSFPFFILLLFGLQAVIAKEPVKPLSDVVPAPVSQRMKPGEFRLTDSTLILVAYRDYDLKTCGQFLADRLGASGGPVVKVTGLRDENKGKKQVILFTYAKKKGKFPKEGYRLQVTPEKITITADEGAGIFHAVQTLLQLMPPEVAGNAPAVRGKSYTIPCCDIYDYPRYSWRGMHLDVSRHFFPKEFIKRYIDMMAMYKMNTFHWHLTDDNGWRIEIKKYPKLTSVGAWRVDRENLPWDERPPRQADEKTTYGGFYTQDDIREIVQYARDRFITIIPEIEMPAHSIEALAAYPQLSCSGGPFTVLPGSFWPNTAVYCAGNDSVFTFLEDVLSEVMELFPSTFIHVGGDEADKTEWTKCPKCQARMKAEGLAGVNELQSYFMKRIEKFVVSKGRKMIGWDEILDGGIAPEATVMSWRGVEGGIAAARQGHDAVMTPTSYCYFDYYQGDPKTEPKAIGGYVPLKKVYSFEPTPQELTKEEAKHILGAQGNIWTEYIPSTSQVEYMAMPRMLALSEVTWSPDKERNWNSFQQRLQEQFKRLDAMKVNYSKGSFRVDILSRYDRKKGKLVITLASEQYKPGIRYSLDGNDPTVSSPVYTAPFELDRNAYIKAGIFVDGKPTGSFTEMPVLFHKGLRAKPAYIQKYSYRYPSSGDGALNDGLRGTVNHRDGLWQGYLGNDAEVIFDLGKKDTVKSVSTTFLINPKSWIFAPEYVEFSLSSDGKHWHSINEESSPPTLQQEGPSIFPYSHLFPPTEARYVKMKAKNRGTCPKGHEGEGQPCWIFVDEVVIY